jgi:hypothetical protein
MIRSITQAKPEAELTRLIQGLDRLFVVGCGTCVTLTRTGGEPQVRAMNEALARQGKLVTGSVVVPVACDNLTAEILDDHGAALKQADALVIMTCAYGVQNIARQLRRLVIPALDTLFIGRETAPGQYDEVCTQCGTCIIGETGGICPVTTCHKGLVNGPCGGTDKGKCEIDKDKDCAWTLIYYRLKDLGRIDSMKAYQKPRNHQGEPSPGKIRLAQDNITDCECSPQST